MTAKKCQKERSADHLTVDDSLLSSIKIFPLLLLWCLCPVNQNSRDICDYGNIHHTLPSDATVAVF